MANIFKQNKDVNNKVKRNNFDLSFQNHLTMKFGTLYPVFCKEVVPGDSFRIQSAFGLKFMPMVFPVQSGMRATMHFFYCRNKNLWKNWENWVSNLEEHTHPYIAQGNDFFKTGSLADYLDVPTTLVSSSPQMVSLNGSSAELRASALIEPKDGSYTAQFPANSLLSTYVNIPSSIPPLYPYMSLLHNPSGATDTLGKLIPFLTPIPSPLLPDTDHTSYVPFTISAHFGENVDLDGLVADTAPYFMFFVSDDSIENSHLFRTASFSANQYDAGRISGNIVFTSTDDIDAINEQISIGKKVYVAILFSLSSTELSQPNFWRLLVQNQTGFGPETIYFTDDFSIQSNVTAPIDLSVAGSTNCPFGRNTGQIRLNALPFRAYQSIYNCYYRNWQNQPYLIGGTPQYNKYIDTDDDGADTTAYTLYQRNYELDFLTSGLPSPQQGNTPLVGMSALGTITIEDEDGITTAKAELADDNDTIVGVQVTSPIAGRAHALTLAEIASAGMSIQDFRNSNALLHWLEVNMRKGYRYIDFVAGHHNVEPKYTELDMPEFIGGYSRDVQVNSILNQTASPEADPLGSFAGTANCFGGSNHDITHYCDDYGWIIGILCVVPQPAYSQLLPKHYLKQSPLDYYFPEFSQLGMQPVTYEEVCPVQSWSDCLADASKSMQDTFCYQRPNYDMISYTDQVHGNFRTDLRNFLINRIFANRPQLGNEFLQINPAEVNDIFQVTTPDNDVIAGQIAFRVFAKRPIPRIHMPSLGR